MLFSKLSMQSMPKVLVEDVLRGKFVVSWPQIDFAFNAISVVPPRDEAENGKPMVALKNFNLKQGVLIPSYSWLLLM